MPNLMIDLEKNKEKEEFVLSQTLQVVELTTDYFYNLAEMF